MANMILVLVQEILMVLFAICATLGNGFLLYIILSRQSLRRNGHLYLITTAAGVDFVYAVCTFPYLILLLSGWGFTYNYPPELMLAFNMPTTILLKVNLIIDFAIGVDRLTAIQWPIAYKMRKRSTYALASLAVGILWAAFDVTYLLTTTTIKPNPLCAAAGCFMSAAYLDYLAISTVIIDSIGLLVTTFVLFNIYTLKTSQMNPNDNRNNSEFTMFKRVNRAAVGALLWSSVTILVPGCIQGIGRLFGFAALQALGPFVAFGLTLKTAANPFIYGFRHHDIRQAIQKFRNMNVPSIGGTTTTRVRTIQ